MIRRQAIAGAVLAGWLAGAMSPEALAQPASNPGAAKSGAASSADPQVERARQLYKDGVKEASRGKWDKARALFTEAFKLRPHFQIAFNLGQAELKLGDYLPAAEHLALFLRDAEGVGDEERRQAREMLDAAERQVATLLVSTEQRGVEVLVDGVSVGETPIGREVFVAPGRRVIQARREGLEPVTEVRTVDAGAYVQVKLTLRKVGQEVAPVTPVAAAEAPASEGPAEGPAEGGANKAVVIAGAVVGVAAAGAGVGFLIASNAKATERGPRQNECTSLAACDSYNHVEIARTNFANASFYSLVAAGAIGMGTLIYALVAPKAKASEAQAKASGKVTATALAGPGGAGVWATVRW